MAKNDLTGQKIGQYLLIERIGEGNSAVVYRAQQTNAFNRDVAVKVMRPELFGNDDFAQRLEIEARTVAKLSHSNILRLIEYIAEDDTVSLVMDYLSGGSLTQQLKQGLLPLDRFDQIAGQIAAALDYAHERSIIHRDLKPQNVLLDESGNAYLCDFGIARLLNENISMTRTGVIIGTPAYMSPEQWEGILLDRRSDIYAFGVMLYEMLTGELPYKAETTTSMMFQHLHSSPRPVEAIRAELPSTVNAALNRSLAKNRDDRYKSAGEFFTILKDALQGIAPEASLYAGNISGKSIGENLKIHTAMLETQGEGSVQVDNPLDDLSTMEFPVIRTISSDKVATMTAPAVQTTRRRPSWLIFGAGAVFALLFIVILAMTNIMSPPLVPIGESTSVNGGATLSSQSNRLDNRRIEQSLVPAGCFTMGSNSANDDNADDAELPAHEVCLIAFWIDTTEVTNEAFAQFSSANAYSDPQWWSEAGWAWLQSTGFAGSEDRGGDFNNPRQPRLNLSWYEADAYTRWRNGRLPTEAEWEYAARGSEERLYAWGMNYQLGYSIINEISRGGTAPTTPNTVASRPTDRSWAGLYDMVGNVCEWTNTWFGPYSTEPQQDPIGAIEGTERVIRGGNFLSSPITARLVARSSRLPESRARSCGVRVVSTP